MNTMINNRDRKTSYTILAKQTMEANWMFLGYRGVVLRNSLPIDRVAQVFCTVLKLVALTIFLFLVVLIAFVRTHPNLVFLWH